MKTDIPNVLIVDLSENFGGASARVLALMSRYPAGKITLAALKDSPVARYAKKENLVVLTVGRKKYDISILFSLVRAIRSFGFEIVDAQNIQSKFWASLAALLTRTSLVSTLNSWYASEHGEMNVKGKIYSAIELLTNWSALHYIVVSKMIYDHLRRAGISPDRIHLIYNAVDMDMNTVTENAKKIRSELDIPADAILCVSLGRLVWAKGYEDLVDAFKIIREKNHRIFCLILGGGKLHSSLAAQITQNELQDRVFLYGPCDHLVALSILKACDVFVMPSRAEGTPIALLEAAALEIPILATKVGGIPELMSDDDALLIPPNDLISLSNGILKLAEEKDLARALSKRARSRVEDYFSVDTQLEATLAAYQFALSQRSGIRKNSRQAAGFRHS